MGRALWVNLCPMSYWSLWPEEYGSQVPQPRSHPLSHSKSNVLFPKVLTRALRLKRGRNQVPTARGGGLPDKSTDGCPLRGGQGSKSGLLPIWPTDHLDSVLQSSLFPKQQILQGRGVGEDGLWVPCGSAGPWLSRPLYANRRIHLRMSATVSRLGIWERCPLSIFSQP